MTGILTPAERVRAGLGERDVRRAAVFLRIVEENLGRILLQLDDEEHFGLYCSFEIKSEPPGRRSRAKGARRKDRSLPDKADWLYHRVLGRERCLVHEIRERDELLRRALDAMGPGHAELRDRIEQTITPPCLEEINPPGTAPQEG